MTVLRITATYEYELPDNSCDRMAAYRTLDTAECIAIDLSAADEIMMGHISQDEDGDEVTYTIVEVK